MAACFGFYQDQWRIYVICRVCHFSLLFVFQWGFAWWIGCGQCVWLILLFLYKPVQCLELMGLMSWSSIQPTRSPVIYHISRRIDLIETSVKLLVCVSCHTICINHLYINSYEVKSKFIYKCKPERNLSLCTMYTYSHELHLILRLVDNIIDIVINSSKLLQNVVRVILLGTFLRVSF